MIPRRLFFLLLTMAVLGIVLVVRDGESWLVTFRSGSLQAPAPSVVAAATFPARSWQEVAQENGWVLDYEEGRRLARESGKPLMVVFRCIP